MYISPDVLRAPGTIFPVGCLYYSLYHSITHNVGHERVHRSHQHGVGVVELFIDMGAHAKEHPQQWAESSKVFLCDICPTAAMVMKHCINEITVQYPEQLLRNATCKTFNNGRLVFIIHDLGIRVLPYL